MDEDNMSLSSISNLKMDNALDDADFGDFQTGGDPVSKNFENDEMNPLTVPVDLHRNNVFELDWFQFKAFRSHFEELITNYFISQNKFEESNIVIRSQEDQINDCVLWYNLTGSFNSKAPLNYYKSETFKHFYRSLKLMDEDQKPNNDQNNEQTIDKNNGINRDQLQTPKNLNKVVNVNEDDDIANDLDMHSLTIGSFDANNSTFNNNISNNKKDHSIDADQVIKEIESIYSGNDQKLIIEGNLCQSGIQKPDPLLSLNASKLLDVALKTWQQANLNSNNLKIYFNDNKYEHSMTDTQENNLDSEYQFYSLPANLNNELNDLTTNFNKSLNDSNAALDLHTKTVSKLNFEAKNKTENFKFSVCNAETNEQNKVTTADYKNNNQIKHEQKEFLEKLNQLSIVQLNELYIELEQIIKIRSEILIDELALRDEYEFEKEQKNTFISLLLSIQNKRKIYSSSAANGDQCSVSASAQHRKGQRHNTYNRLVRRNTNDGINSVRKNVNNSGLLNLARDLTNIGSSIKESILPSVSKVNPGYLTMVIPYKNSMMPLDLSTLQMLNKLLKALNDDSPTVPELITEYILKVICP